MCTTCGCGNAQVMINGEPAEGHEHDHAHPHEHAHSHEHSHDGMTHVHEHPHAHEHPHHHDAHHHDDHHHEHGESNHAHAFGGEQHNHPHAGNKPRIVDVERNLLEKNDAVARLNRQHFADHAVFALNLVSSPGSGKTTLLVKTIEQLKSQCLCRVIEGDQQTQNDAARVRATGVPAVQINTGKGCHLDALMVQRALTALPTLDEALLFIENVGNLVCPAAFDLGEAHKVAILSVTEGADKPQKYPDMFHAAGLMIINKVDLLPYVDFDIEQAVTCARQVNPDIKVLRISATTGEGMDEWLNWLRDGLHAAKQTRDNNVVLLREKIAALEAQLSERR